MKYHKSCSDITFRHLKDALYPRNFIGKDETKIYTFITVRTGIEPTNPAKSIKIIYVLTYQLRHIMHRRIFVLRTYRDQR